MRLTQDTVCVIRMVGRLPANSKERSSTTLYGQYCIEGTHPAKANQRRWRLSFMRAAASEHPGRIAPREE
eukprot:6477222-Amphidinium_carterae.1